MIAPYRTHACLHCGKTEVYAPPAWRWLTLPPDAGYFDERLLGPVCSDGCEAKVVSTTGDRVTND
jgi:hypothetical protein